MLYKIKLRVPGVLYRHTYTHVTCGGFFSPSKYAILYKTISQERETKLISSPALQGATNPEVFKYRKIHVSE